MMFTNIFLSKYKKLVNEPDIDTESNIGTVINKYNCNTTNHIVTTSNNNDDINSNDNINSSNIDILSPELLINILLHCDLQSLFNFIQTNKFYRELFIVNVTTFARSLGFKFKPDIKLDNSITIIDHDKKLCLNSTIRSFFKKYRLHMIERIGKCYECYKDKFKDLNMKKMYRLIELVEYNQINTCYILDYINLSDEYYSNLKTIINLKAYDVSYNAYLIDIVRLDNDKFNKAIELINTKLISACYIIELSCVSNKQYSNLKLLLNMESYNRNINPYIIKIIRLDDKHFNRAIALIKLKIIYSCYINDIVNVSDTEYSKIEDILNIEHFRGNISPYIVEIVLLDDKKYKKAFKLLESQLIYPYDIYNLCKLPDKQYNNLIEVIDSGNYDDSMLDKIIGK